MAKIIYTNNNTESANKIINLFMEDSNQIIKRTPDKFPSMGIYPIQYARKLYMVTISVSASTSIEEPINTINCIFHRIDNDKIDQDEFGFYYNYSTNTPSVSGCMLYHGSWEQRTEDSIKAKSMLNKIPEDLPIILEEAPISYIKGHIVINKEIMKMKKCINCRLKASILCNNDN